MTDLNDSFLDTLKETMNAYCVYGARSSKKVEPIHGFIARTLENYLPAEKGYKIEALGYTDYEGSIPTGFGDTKNVDIKISKYGFDIGCVLVKYICSSYAKNSKNYIETMVGETTSIHRAKNSLGQEILVWQLIVLPEYLPTLNKDNKIVQIEFVNNDELTRYTNVNNWEKSYDKPDILSLHLINTGNLEYLEQKRLSNEPIDQSSDEYINALNITYSDYSGFSKENAECLDVPFDIHLEEFVDKCIQNNSKIEFENAKRLKETADAFINNLQKSKIVA